MSLNGGCDESGEPNTGLEEQTENGYPAARPVPACSMTGGPMEMLFTVDCERFIPNRYDLVHAGVARARALARGAEPRTEGDDSVGTLALREIAEGRFNPDEIQALLASAWRPEGDHASLGYADEEALRDGLAQSGAIALASQQREALVGASVNKGGR